MVAVAVAIVAALLAAFARASGAPTIQTLLPLGVAGGLGMAWLAMRRFTVFVAAILIARASLDALKPPGTSSFLDPAALLSGAFLVAGGIWLLVQPRAERAPRSPLVAPLALLASVGAVSTLLSSHTATGIGDVVKLGTVVLMLAVLNQVCRTPRDTKIVLAAAFASALIPLAVAAYQGATHTGFHVSGSFERVRGTFDHPNPFSIYLCVTIIMAAGLYRFVSSRSRVLLTLLIAACAAALFFTYTRSAWISTIVGLLVVGRLIGRRVVGVVAVAVVVAVLSVPGISARFSDLSQATTQSGAAGNSLVWRLGYWRQALQLNSDPLLGQGLSAVRIQGSELKEPHNDFIRVYVETGLLGLAAYLWFLWRAFGVARRATLEDVRGLWRGVGIGFSGLFAAYVLLSVVSNVITQLVLLWYVGAYAAAAVAAPRLARRAETAPLPAPTTA